MADKSQILACVLIPVQDQLLLLPNVSIAEIVDLTDTPDKASSKTGILGRFHWRGMDLPIVSYESANGGEVPETGSGRGRILVLNSIGDSHDKLPFIALATQGIPRQAKIEETQLKPRKDNTGPADVMAVDYDGEAAVIPNLEYLEKLALEAMTH